MCVWSFWRARRPHFPCILVLEMSSSRRVAVAPLGPLYRERTLVSALPFRHLLPLRPPPPLPLSVASSKDALSISCTPGVTPVEEQAGKEGGRERAWLGGRKIISARLLCLRLKPDLHFKSSGRSCCHLRDAIDQPACHLMSAGSRALMKLIEQPMIDNGTAHQRHCHDHPPVSPSLQPPSMNSGDYHSSSRSHQWQHFYSNSTFKCFWLP